MADEITLSYTQLKAIMAELDERSAKMPTNWSRDGQFVYIGEPQLTLLPVRYPMPWPSRGYETKLMNRTGEFIHTYISG